ncbi:MAG: hypothetical protein QOE96_3026 [Blastocatellia bacterium]|nr:hypothetical protein [Blastocatellia bacterium]
MPIQWFLRLITQNRFLKLSSRMRPEPCAQLDHWLPLSNRGHVTEVRSICGRKEMWKRLSNMCCSVGIVSSLSIESPKSQPSLTVELVPRNRSGQVAGGVP